MRRPRTGPTQRPPCPSCPALPPTSSPAPTNSPSTSRTYDGLVGYVLADDYDHFETTIDPATGSGDHLRPIGDEPNLELDFGNHNTTVAAISAWSGPGELILPTPGRWGHDGEDLWAACVERARAKPPAALTSRWGFRRSTTP
ncbi:hypothetical protein ACWGR4_39355 [Embleya sp. NPDC055664]